MQDKELKKLLIENGALDKYRARSYELFKQGINHDERLKTLKKEFKDFKALYQLMRARHEQKKKVLKQFIYYKERDYKIYFLTLTIKDEILNTTEERYLKRRAIEALENADDFSINIDFGDDTERMHWHGLYFSKNGLNVIEKEKHKTKKEKYITVLKTDDKPLNDYAENTGNITIQEVKTGTEKCVCNYLSKITQHSIKIKQKYISTRKGSPYNEYKEHNRKIRKYQSLNYDIYSLPSTLRANSIIEFSLEKDKKELDYIKSLPLSELSAESQELYLYHYFK